jgi:hypothetical protein
VLSSSALCVLNRFVSAFVIAQWGGLIVGLLHLLPVYGFYSAPSTAAASSVRRLPRCCLVCVCVVLSLRVGVS